MISKKDEIFGYIMNGITHNFIWYIRRQIDQNIMPSILLLL